MILKLTRKKTLSSLDCKSKYYVALEFSKTEESKILIALSGPPDWHLIHFAWDKARCLGSVSVKAQENMKFTHCFFHPK